jgi:diguanylate cyclase (GGDEF)-like protein/PAS domain S-box-containing protein
MPISIVNRSLEYVRRQPLVLALCAAQCIAVFVLIGELSPRAASTAAAIIALSALIMAAPRHRSIKADGCQEKACPYDKAIDEFFYVLKSDRHGRFIEANRRYLQRMGYTPQELSDQSRNGLRAGRYETSYPADMWPMLLAGRTWCGEFCDEAKDGSRIWMSAIVIPWRGEQGDFEFLTTIGVDVTDQRKAEQASKEANSRLMAFVKHAPAAVAMFDTEMRYVAHTDRWLSDYHLEQASLVGRTHYEVFPEIPEHWKLKHQRILGGAVEFCEEEKFVRADGQENVIRWEVRPWYLPDQSIGGMMMMTEEITERNKLQKKLWRLAKLDTLTSLPNRLSFNELLLEEIAHAASVKQQFAVALLDIDRLKEINDTLGHDVGDQVLKALAANLNYALRGMGTIARLGGDEFAILIRGQDSEISAALHAIQSALERPLPVGSTRRNCTASIGVTKFPEDAVDAGNLLKNADIALYRAKSEGRDRIVSFVPEMRNALRRKVELQQEALQALANNQFLLYYQPVVSAYADQPLSFEALLRWWHPVHGLLAPGSFQEVLQEPKLASAIGECVIDMALRQAASWLAEGKKFGRIAVNVTSADFSFGCFATRLQANLVRHNVPPRKLCIEVTEQVFLGAGAAHVAEAMQRISAMGVEVALDDFGTGYASLTHLKAFPIDRLKIDRSFVQDMHENNDSLSIVQAIVHLGQSLALRVTAEGVENHEQFVLLQSMGCGSFQGYYISPPRPADEVSISDAYMQAVHPDVAIA